MTMTENMPLTESMTLAQRMGEGPLPAAEAIRYALQLADALSRLREAGRAHGAVTPASLALVAGTVELLPAAEGSCASDYAVHGAGSGAGPCGRRTERPVQLRGHCVRDVDGPTGIRWRKPGDAGGESHATAGALDGQCGDRPGGGSVPEQRPERAERSDAETDAGAEGVERGGAARRCGVWTQSGACGGRKTGLRGKRCSIWRRG